jgi:Eco57I restriction-modification methylase
MLYQELVDPGDRQLLAEFYTPDWLADLMLERIAYEGGSLLDPACGSGTFLFSAIRRLRSKGMKGQELVKETLASVTGIDAHPVAVLMAKANILLALASELREYPDDVYLRIYLADTLMTGEDIKKRRLAVSAGQDGTFSIPLDSIEKGRDLDRLVDQMTLFARHGSTSKAAEGRALKGFAKLLEGYTDEEVFHWRHNFSLLAKIMKEKRDTVWGFILKNAYRPAYLRRQKVDVVIANPPWLSLRDIQDPAYKKRLKELAFAYHLLEKTDRNLFTQLDTSTVFFAHAEKQFLNNDGTMAFVMPKAVILPAKQHLLFQKVGFTEIHDFGAVRGLFRVPSCVVIRGREVWDEEIPIINWAGELKAGQRNALWSKVRHLLKSETNKLSFLIVPTEKSYYYPHVLQGATLVPRGLWFVEPPRGQAVNVKTPLLQTPWSITSSAKKPWKMRLKGKVENGFLFGTALSEDLLPFVLRQLRLVVLPVLKKGSRVVMLNSEEVLAEGAPYASEWVKRAEAIWEKRKKEGQPSVFDYLNYDQKLTKQNIGQSFVVLYNKSGTNLAAAYVTPDEVKRIGKLPIQGFVADHVTYRFYADSKEHALYLVGVLNSSVVNETIKPYQSQGLQGERDIHRRPFEVCPIPRFDLRNDLHIRIGKVALSARDKMMKWRSQIGGKTAQARQAARKIIAPELAEIDALVGKLLIVHAPSAQQPKSSANTMANLFVPHSEP